MPPPGNQATRTSVPSSCAGQKATRARPGRIDSQLTSRILAAHLPGPPTNGTSLTSGPPTGQTHTSPGICMEGTWRHLLSALAPRFIRTEEPDWPADTAQHPAHLRKPENLGNPSPRFACLSDGCSAAAADLPANVRFPDRIGPRRTQVTSPADLGQAAAIAASHIHARDTAL
jgi:hypothetical protein